MFEEIDYLLLYRVFYRTTSFSCGSRLLHLIGTIHHVNVAVKTGAQVHRFCLYLSSSAQNLS
jgi:hypothetical protein